MKISKKKPLSCMICGKETSRMLKGGKAIGDYRKTCSTQCHKERTRNVFKKVNIDNKEKFSALSSERMKKKNPMWIDGVKEKMIATNKALGVRPKIRGGNGKEMPVAQRVLLTALGEDWCAEYSVLTFLRGKTKENYASCYKIDIANPKKMIGIEVDGESHNALYRKEQDKKKEKFLSSLGWKIIRFKNKEVMSNLDNVLNKIYAEIV